VQKVADVYSSCIARHHELREQQRAITAAAAAAVGVESKQHSRSRSLQSASSVTSTTSAISSPDVQVVSPVIRPSTVPVLLCSTVLIILPPYPQYSYQVLQSACLSVCLSHTDIVQKWLNVGSRKQRHAIAQGFYFYNVKGSAKFHGVICNRGAK